MLRPIILLLTLFTTNLQAQEIISGTFESKEGVMDVISCHCGDGGYIHTYDGDYIPVCLDLVEATVDDGSEIVLEGDWVISSIEPDGFSPCPSDDLQLFEVSEVIIEDEEGILITEEYTFEGNFTSTRGRMVKLSCFCYDGGYLVTDDGDEFDICFEGLEESEVDAIRNCDEIRVVGEFITKNIELSPNGNCGGSRELFQVTAVECL